MQTVHETSLPPALLRQDPAAYAKTAAWVTLGIGLARGLHRGRGVWRGVGALAALGAIAALGATSRQQRHRAEHRERAARFDYSDRSGFPALVRASPVPPSDVSIGDPAGHADSPAGVGQPSPGR